MTCNLYKQCHSKCSLHFKNINVSNIWEDSLARWGLMINPPLLKMRSTGALLAGTHRMLHAREYSDGYFIFPMLSSFQNVAASIPWISSLKNFSSWVRTLSLSPLFVLRRMDLYLARRRGIFEGGSSSSLLVALPAVLGPAASSQSDTKFVILSFFL